MRTLKKTVGALPGVDDLQFDVVNGRMTVDFNPDRVSDDDIRRGVEQARLSADMNLLMLVAVLGALDICE